MPHSLRWNFKHEKLLSDSINLKLASKNVQCQWKTRMWKSLKGTKNHLFKWQIETKNWNKSALFQLSGQTSATNLNEKVIFWHLIDQAFSKWLKKVRYQTFQVQTWQKCTSKQSGAQD